VGDFQSNQPTTAGGRIISRPHRCPLAFALHPLQDRYRAKDIAPVVAAFAAHCSQQEYRQQVFFKEIAGARAVYLVPTASPAVEFVKKLRPGRSHKAPRYENKSKPD